MERNIHETNPETALVQSPNDDQERNYFWRENEGPDHPVTVFCVFPLDIFAKACRIRANSYRKKRLSRKSSPEKSLRELPVGARQR